MAVMSNHTSWFWAAPARPVAASSSACAAQGVAVRVGSRALPFDWNDRPTWDGALDGVSVVYVSFYPDIAIEGAPELVGAFARLAARAGVGGSCCSPAAASPRRSGPSRS